MNYFDRSNADMFQLYELKLTALYCIRNKALICTYFIRSNADMFQLIELKLTALYCIRNKALICAYFIRSNAETAKSDSIICPSLIRKNHPNT